MGRHRYYAVLETLKGHMIATELSADGVVAWKVNPVDLELRNSLAKVISSADCALKPVAIRDMRTSLAKVVARWQTRRAHCTGKRYAQCAYKRACATEPSSA